MLANALFFLDRVVYALIRWFWKHKPHLIGCSSFSTLYLYPLPKNRQNNEEIWDKTI